MMKLRLTDLNNSTSWEEAGIALPSYSPKAVQENTKNHPRWVHFGIGNIFRIFLGGIADRLLAEGLMDSGITCVEAFDFSIVDDIYKPYDNLTLAVTLFADGSTQKRVLGSLGEAVKADFTDQVSRERLYTIFTDPKLQMVSYTITEKGYSLWETDGSFKPFAKADIEKGPLSCTGVMAITTALLYERFKKGGAPLTLVSMDNCSHNGENLKRSIQVMAREWEKQGFVEKDFIDYLADEKRIAFPWTMIDKITPRPSDAVSKMLTLDGVEDMQILETDKHTFIAPFVNAERPAYLVVEDSFTNGRPPLEKAGVYMTDRDTVNLCERMKVTACLNPIHTALAPYGMLLGYDLFADLMEDPELNRLAHLIGYQEGLPYVEDPGILSPKAFLEECLTERFPNRYLGDTNARICTDASQGVSVRFGETIKAHVKTKGTAADLRGIPLAIAGLLRYFIGIDDTCKAYTLAPDPLAEEIHQIVSSIHKEDDPSLISQKLKPLLSNQRIFGVDLYEAGIGTTIEEIFQREIQGPGAVRETLQAYLAD